MTYKVFSTLNLMFKMLCLCVVLFMIAYWIYKYALDEDVCLVDYKILANADEDIDVSEVSLCTFNSLNVTSQKELISDVNLTLYVEYLKGNNYNEEFKHLEFDDISLNIDESNI